MKKYKCRICGHEFLENQAATGEDGALRCPVCGKPMVLESPVYISHMSFGAFSRESKIALAKGSAMAKTTMCSGEGGILPEEMDSSYKYIFEYVPNG